MILRDDFTDDVFPAHAGVILSFQPCLTMFVSFSRTRGGDPVRKGRNGMTSKFFPHTRG